MLIAISNLNYKNAQQGVALLTALLIVAMVSVIAAAMASRQQLDIRLTENVLDGDRVRLIGLGGEAWALGQVARNTKSNAAGEAFDSLLEEWAKPLESTPMENGEIRAGIIDAQGRFNLNNLVLSDNPSNDDTTYVNRQVEYLRSLLSALELDPNLAWAVADWVDADMNTHPEGGAEDPEYSDREPAYRAANRPMASVSELRLVAGFDQEVYLTLLPYVSALPERTTLNVNTAEAKVLMGLHPKLEQGIAEAIASELKTNPMTSKQEISDRLKVVLGDNTQILDTVEQDIDVSSHYFLATTDATMGRSRTKLQTLIHADPDKGTRVVAHGFGEL